MLRRGQIVYTVSRDSGHALAFLQSPFVNVAHSGLSDPSEVELVFIPACAYRPSPGERRSLKVEMTPTSPGVQLPCGWPAHKAVLLILINQTKCEPGSLPPPGPSLNHSAKPGSFAVAGECC